MNRPTFTEYARRIAREVASRSTCSRLSVGAVAMRNMRIVGTGYNGAPPGVRHCEHEVYPGMPHLDPDLSLRNGRFSCHHAVHAEHNVVLYAKQEGISLVGCDLFVTTYPCFDCAEHIVHAGIRAVFIDRPRDYPHDPRVSQIAREFGVILHLDPVSA